MESNKTAVMIVTNGKNEGASYAATLNFGSNKEKDDKVDGTDHVSGGGEQRGCQIRSLTENSVVTTPV